MGIPKFFRYIAERWPSMLQSVNDSVIPEFDNLYLDMNSIIHNATRSNNDIVLEDEEEIFKNVFNYIEHLFYVIKPKKVFYMAIDGVAPRAKMNQQRSRRFRAALEQEEQLREAAEAGIELGTEDPFDRNCITPGTEFMARLTIQLKYFISRKVSEDSNWQVVKVILSGHEVPGEGEHKIMNFIRHLRDQPDYSHNTRHCLYGLDADLIMLGLTTHEPHFSILRENVTFGRTPSPREQELDQMKLLLLHLSMTREYIQLEFDDLLNDEDNTGKQLFDFERMLDDFILINFFIGNDFLPELPMLLVHEGAIPIILQTYSRYLRVNREYLTDKGDINFQALKAWMKEMSKFQIEKFEGLAKDAVWFNNSLSTVSPLNATDEEEEDSLQHLTAHQRSLVSDLKQFILGVYAKTYDGESLQLDDDCLEEYKFVSLLAQQCGLEIEESEDDEGAKIQLMKPSPATLSLDDSLKRKKKASAQSIIRVYEKHTTSAAETKERQELYDQKLDVWRNKYYKSKFHSELNSETIADAVQNYLEGLQWVYSYYYKGCPSWDWFYRYHYAPMTMELVDAITPDFKVEFKQTEPAKPFEQLLAVMSHRSAKLLPPVYRHLMIEPTSPIIEFYPHDFQVDLNGKKRDWEGVVLIPFVDMTALRSAMEADNAKLNDDEKRRNLRGVELGFDYDPNITFVYKSPLNTLPSIERCHCRIKELDLDVVSQSKNVLAMAKESKLGNNMLYGFPSLQHLDFDFEIKNVGVRIFEFPSRIDSIVISIKQNERKEVLAEVAERLLGTNVYVDYPFLCEARVTGVSEGFHLLRKAGKKIVEQDPDNQVEQEIRRQVSSFPRNLLQSRGIDCGRCTIMVHFQRFEGMTRDSNGNTRKHFGTDPSTEAVIPLQLVVEDVASEDERFMERQAKPVEEEFPKGTQGLLLLNRDYGSPSQVVGHENGTLEVAFLRFRDRPPTEPRGIAHNDAVQMQYNSARGCCKAVNMTPVQFSRITSNFRVEFDGQNFNLGLPLKKASQNQKALGYTRMGPFAWEYSKAAVELVRQYVTAFPELVTMMFRTVAHVPNLSDGADQGRLDFIGDKVNKARKWIREKTANIEYTKLEDQRMSPAAMALIENWAKTYTQVPPVVTRETLKNLPRSAFVATDQAAPVLRQQTFSPGDRVISALSHGKVPQFSHGTVVGTFYTRTGATVDVVFDDELSTGSDFGGNIKSKRGATVDSTSILNLSTREKALFRKEDKESFSNAAALGSTSNQALRQKHNSQSSSRPQKAGVRPGVKLSKPSTDRNAKVPSAPIPAPAQPQAKPRPQQRADAVTPVAPAPLQKESRIPTNPLAKKGPAPKKNGEPRPVSSKARPAAIPAKEASKPAKKSQKQRGADKSTDAPEPKADNPNQHAKSPAPVAEALPAQNAVPATKKPAEAPQSAEQLTIPAPSKPVDKNDKKAALAQRLMANFQNKS